MRVGGIGAEPHKGISGDDRGPRYLARITE
jgi:hypothetical protein